MINCESNQLTSRIPLHHISVFAILQAQPHQSNVILVNAVPQDDSDSAIFIASDGSASARLVTLDSSQVGDKFSTLQPDQ